MDSKQVKDFLEQAATMFSNFEVTPSRLTAWTRHLKTMDNDLALKRLDGYAQMNKFPPTVADIVSSGEMKQRERHYGDETRSPADTWGDKKKTNWQPFFTCSKEEMDVYKAIAAEREDGDFILGDSWRSSHREDE